MTDIYGNPVDPTTTDESGKYLFDYLPPLPAGQHYTVRIDNTQPALTPYLSTKAGAGSDGGTDSSTGSAESGDLSKGGDEDLTLDFGFVKPSVSVGDLVWVDLNGNGEQDRGEPGITGVVVTLVGPDGKPVTDVNGKQVKPLKTDKDGLYSFDDLPPLPAGQHYTVRIDRDQKVLEPYLPTKAGAGNRDDDSSTWTADSRDLTDNGDRDPSLDFGFVLRNPAPTPSRTPSPSSGPSSVAPSSTVPPSTGPSSTVPPTEPPGLPGTGGVALGVLLAGLTLLLGGVVMSFGRRGRRE